MRVKENTFLKNSNKGIYIIPLKLLVFLDSNINKQVQYEDYHKAILFTNYYPFMLPFRYDFWS